MDAVKKHARQQFEKFFPNPTNIPSEDYYLLNWDNYTQSLLKAFGQQKDFRLAFNHGINIVKEYQITYSWPFSPASYLVTNKPESQLRNKDWLEKAWALYDTYQQWLNDYIVHNQNDIEFRYKSLLLSLIFDSGQCNEDVVIAFNQELKKQNHLPLFYFKKYIFATVRLDNNNLNTNEYVNGLAITTYQCYLSLKTLGQLKLWQNLNKTGWEYPKDKNQLFGKIISGLPYNNKRPTTLKKFCSVSAFWFEKHGNSQISEALLEYRIGKTSSYSLPISNLKRLITPTIYPTSASLFFDFSTDIAIKYQRGNETHQTQRPLAKNQLLNLLKITCKPKHNGIKISAEKIKKNLENLLDDYQFELWQKIFIEWLIYKTMSCKSKTVNQYMLNQAKYWIFMNEDYNLYQITSPEDLEDLYLEQINRHSTTKSKDFFSKRLKDLHSFAAYSLGLPHINGEIFHSNVTKKHTSAGLIDEPLFRTLLQHINQLKDLNDSDKLALQTICIISYRCGLRPNELNKLQIKNIENSSTGWISIRPNRFGDNKKAASLRKVPLFPLLLTHEEKIVSAYLRLKHGQHISQSAPLLTIGTNLFQPFNMFTVSNFIGRMLKALSGQHHFIFYHFRHSCISRLHLMLELDNPSDILPHFYPYSKPVTDKLRKLIFKQTQCKGYWEIAAFAGHESPKVTFKHYFHLSDLLAARLIEEESTHVSRDQSQRLGLCTRRQYQAIHKQHNSVNYEYFYPILLESLQCSNIQSLSDISAIQTSLDLPTKELISIDICYRVLEKISQGENINDLTYRYRLKQETIDKWLANANYLKSLMTEINNSEMKASRHFSEQRTNALVPGKPKAQTELAYVDNFIEKIRKRYTDPTNKAMIQEMMIYCLTHTSVSKSGINFNSPAQLKNFIDTFHFAIPFAHWRAVKLYVNNSKIKKDWQEILSGIKTTEEKKGISNSRKTNGSVRLELINPDESEYIKNSNLQKYSSHLLVYLMYMSFVMLHKSHEIN